jgi:hypothetical protein
MHKKRKRSSNGRICRSDFTSVMKRGCQMRSANKIIFILFSLILISCTGGGGGDGGGSAAPADSGSPTVDNSVVELSGVADNAFDVDGVALLSDYTNGVQDIYIETKTNGNDIYPAGWVSSASKFYMAIGKMNDDGEFDLTFGNNSNGWIYYVIGSGSSYLTKVIELDSNHLLLIGFTDYSSISTGIMLKVRKDTGAVDTNFGTNGVAYVGDTTYLNLANLVGQDSYFHDAKVQSDGTIVAVGSQYDLAATEHRFFVVKFNADGSIAENQSAQKQRKTFDFGGNDYGLSIVNDGTNMIVAGKSIVGGDSDYAFIKIDQEFDLVTSFGASGWKVLTVDTDDQMKKIDIYQGQLYFVGQSSGKCFVGRASTSTGAYDTAFGELGGGTLINGSTQCTDFTIDADQELILLGDSIVGSWLMKWDVEAKTRDSGFGTNGTVSLSTNSSDKSGGIFLDHRKRVIAGVSLANSTSYVYRIK